jgi:hypothetical protein
MKDTAIELTALDRECSVFCRYLIGQNPNEYVREKYREAHRSRSFSRYNRSKAADGFLVKIARISPWSTQFIDVYSSCFERTSLVRKKLVLLLAILESAAPSHLWLESVDSTIGLIVVKSALRSVTFVMLLLLSFVVIFPFQMVLRGSANFIGAWLPRHG